MTSVPKAVATSIMTIYTCLSPPLEPITDLFFTFTSFGTRIYDMSDVLKGEEGQKHGRGNSLPFLVAVISIS
jgi:hypothetical protein